MEEVSEVRAEFASEEFLPAGSPVGHMLHPGRAEERSDVEAKLSTRGDGVLLDRLDDERKHRGKFPGGSWTEGVERG